MMQPDAKLSRDSYVVAMMSDRSADVYGKAEKNALRAEAKLKCKNGSWCALLHILALSTVTQQLI